MELILQLTGVYRQVFVVIYHFIYILTHALLWGCGYGQ